MNTEIVYKVSHVAVSSSLAAVTDGKSNCTVWELDTGQRHAFSTGRRRLGAIAVFGKVGLLYDLEIGKPISVILQLAYPSVRTR